MTSTTRIERTSPTRTSRPSLRTDVRAGLTATPKMLPPKYFYDDRGSELFEEITRLAGVLPDPRRARRSSTARADEIADLTGADTLVELGSGSSEKTRLLLDALRDAGTLRRYVPVDVSDGALEAAVPRPGRASYPGLDGARRRRDFERHLDRLPTDGPRLIAFLGGTIGNLEPEQRAGVPGRGRRADAGPATRSCSAPTWSRTPAAWSGPTTTRPA